MAADLVAWGASALPVVWVWTLDALSSTLSSAFLALRLGVFALLVCVAWVRIIEEDEGGPYSTVLSAGVLRAHDAAARGAHHGQQHRPPPSEPASLTESVDWSVWDGGEDESAADEAAPTAPETPSLATRPQPASLPAPARPAAVAATAGPHPPVTVSAVPTPPSQQTSTASAVLLDEVAEVAEDEEEKQMLAGAAVAAGGGLAEAGKHAVQAGIGKPGERDHGKRKKKKPWLNRKLESFFKPYSEQYHAAGFMMYRGFNRAGKRMERSATILGKHLDGSIRDVGASAVMEGERLLKKWVKFAGVVAFLTLVLMPLPSVHVALTTG